MQPLELINVLSDTFLYDIPETAETPEDMQEISRLLVRTANEFAFLAQLASAAKVSCRTYKRLGKEYKTLYEDAVDKKEGISSITDAVELRYKTLSRIITIRQEINKELKMNVE